MPESKAGKVLLEGVDVVYTRYPAEVAVDAGEAGAAEPVAGSSLAPFRYPALQFLDAASELVFDEVVLQRVGCSGAAASRWSRRAACTDGSSSSGSGSGSGSAVAACLAYGAFRGREAGGASERGGWVLDWPPACVSGAPPPPLPQGTQQPPWLRMAMAAPPQVAMTGTGCGGGDIGGGGSVLCGGGGGGGVGSAGPGFGADGGISGVGSSNGGLVNSGYVGEGTSSSKVELPSSEHTASSITGPASYTGAWQPSSPPDLPAAAAPPTLPPSSLPPPSFPLTSPPATPPPDAPPPAAPAFPSDFTNAPSCWRALARQPPPWFTTLSPLTFINCSSVRIQNLTVDGVAGIFHGAVHVAGSNLRVDGGSCTRTASAGSGACISAGWGSTLRISGMRFLDNAAGALHQLQGIVSNPTDFLSAVNPIMRQTHGWERRSGGDDGLELFAAAGEVDDGAGGNSSTTGMGDGSGGSGGIEGGGSGSGGDGGGGDGGTGRDLVLGARLAQLLGLGGAVFISTHRTHVCDGGGGQQRGSRLEPGSAPAPPPPPAALAAPAPPPQLQEQEPQQPPSHPEPPCWEPLSIEGCTFEGGWAQAGGAVALSGGGGCRGLRLSITGSNFTNNQAWMGGGVTVLGPASHAGDGSTDVRLELEIRDTVFAGNQARDPYYILGEDRPQELGGGAVAVLYGQSGLDEGSGVSLRDAKFVGNLCRNQGQGGGLLAVALALGGRVSVERCSFADNKVWPEAMRAPPRDDSGFPDSGLPGSKNPAVNTVMIEERWAIQRNQLQTDYAVGNRGGAVAVVLRPSALQRAQQEAAMQPPPSELQGFLSPPSLLPPRWHQPDAFPTPATATWGLPSAARVRVIDTSFSGNQASMLGGALLVEVAELAGSLELQNSSFSTGVTLYGSGGAVAVMAGVMPATGRIQVAGCRFVDNAAGTDLRVPEDGGLIVLEDDSTPLVGGAIGVMGLGPFNSLAVKGAVEVADSQFVRNRALDGIATGGGLGLLGDVATGGRLEVRSSGGGAHRSGADGSNSGGGVGDAGSEARPRTQFSGCKAVQGGAVGITGSVEGTLALDGIVFEDNIATLFGGSIAVGRGVTRWDHIFGDDPEPSSARLMLTNLTMRRSKATSRTSAGGDIALRGSVVAGATVLLQDVTSENSSAASTGGFLWLGGGVLQEGAELVLRRTRVRGSSLLLSNSAAGASDSGSMLGDGVVGGGALSFGCSPTSINRIFGLYGALLLEDTEVVGSTAGLGGLGGALCLNSTTALRVANFVSWEPLQWGQVVVRNCSLSNGTAGYGGAVAIASMLAGNLTLERSRLNGNAASTSGGAVALLGAISRQARLRVLDSELSGNQAGLGGGALAVVWGGGVGGVPIDISTGGGGADMGLVSDAYGYLELVGSRFEGNTVSGGTAAASSAEGGGGAVLLSPETPLAGLLNISRCTFRRNTASRGSGGALAVAAVAFSPITDMQGGRMPFLTYTTEHIQRPPWPSGLVQVTDSVFEGNGVGRRDDLLAQSAGGAIAYTAVCRRLWPSKSRRLLLRGAVLAGHRHGGSRNSNSSRNLGSSGAADDGGLGGWGGLQAQPELLPLPDILVRSCGRAELRLARSSFLRNRALARAGAVWAGLHYPEESSTGAATTATSSAATTAALVLQMDRSGGAADFGLPGDVGMATAEEAAARGAAAQLAVLAEGCEFRGNVVVGTADGSGSGGAISVEGGVFMAPLALVGSTGNAKGSSSGGDDPNRSSSSSSSATSSAAASSAAPRLSVWPPVWLEVRGSVFDSNSATARGGAIFSSNTSTLLHNCSFSRNFAATGGAVAFAMPTFAHLLSLAAARAAALAAGGDGNTSEALEPPPPPSPAAPGQFLAAGMQDSWSWSTPPAARAAALTAGGDGNTSGALEPPPPPSPAAPGQFLAAGIQDSWSWSTPPASPPPRQQQHTGPPSLTPSAHKDGGGTGSGDGAPGGKAGAGPGCSCSNTANSARSSPNSRAGLLPAALNADSATAAQPAAAPAVAASAAMTYGSLVIRHCDLRRNLARSAGGALALMKEINAVDEQVAAPDDAAGAAPTSMVAVLVEATLFAENEASSKAQQGAAGSVNRSATSGSNGSNGTSKRDLIGTMASRASGDGGALHAADVATAITVTETSFNGNTAAMSGGAVYVRACTAPVRLSSIMADSCSAGLGGGGALHFVDNAHVIALADALISGAAASGDGGGVSAVGNAAGIAARRLTIVDSSSGGRAGGLFLGANGVAELCCVKVSRCMAREAGGGVGVVASEWVEAASLEVRECRSAARGGGLALARSEVAGWGWDVSGCEAAISGGGVFVSDTITATSSASTAAAVEAEAADAGAVALVSLSDSRVMNNLASGMGSATQPYNGFGGGMFVGGRCVVALTGVNFTANVAANLGAALASKQQCRPQQPHPPPPPAPAVPQPQPQVAQTHSPLWPQSAPSENSVYALMRLTAAQDCWALALHNTAISSEAVVGTAVGSGTSTKANLVWLPDASALAVGCGDSSAYDPAGSAVDSRQHSAPAAPVEPAGEGADVSVVLSSPMRRWAAARQPQSAAGAEALRALRQTFARCATGARDGRQSAAESLGRQQQQTGAATAELDDGLLVASVPAQLVLRSLGVQAAVQAQLPTASDAGSSTSSAGGVGSNTSTNYTDAASIGPANGIVRTLLAAGGNASYASAVTVPAASPPAAASGGSGSGDTAAPSLALSSNAEYTATLILTDAWGDRVTGHVEATVRISLEPAPAAGVDSVSGSSRNQLATAMLVQTQGESMERRTQDGTVTWRGLQVRGLPGRYVLVFRAAPSVEAAGSSLPAAAGDASRFPDLTLQHNFVLQPCAPGEEPSPGLDSCSTCRTQQYGLWGDPRWAVANVSPRPLSGDPTSTSGSPSPSPSPSRNSITGGPVTPTAGAATSELPEQVASGLALCAPCPENAWCPGGPLLVPAPRYWHSGPGSTLIHRCMNPEACQGGTESLRAAAAAAAPASSISGSTSKSDSGGGSTGPAAAAEYADVGTPWQRLGLAECQEAGYAAALQLATASYASFYLNSTAAPTGPAQGRMDISSSSLHNSSSSSSSKAGGVDALDVGVWCALWGLPPDDPHSYMQLQCSDGYTGPLCAACAPGYYSSGAFECSECPSNMVQMGIVSSLGVLASVALALGAAWAAYTADHTRTDVRISASDLLQVIISHMQYFIIICRLNISWPEALQKLVIAMSVLTGAENLFAYSPSCFKPGADPAQQAAIELFTALIVPALVLVLTNIFWALRYAAFNTALLRKAGGVGSSGGMRMLRHTGDDPLAADGGLELRAESFLSSVSSAGGGAGGRVSVESSPAASRLPSIDGSASSALPAGQARGSGKGGHASSTAPGMVASAPQPTLGDRQHQQAGDVPAAGGPQQNAGAALGITGAHDVAVHGQQGSGAPPNSSQGGDGTGCGSLLPTASCADDDDQQQLGRTSPRRSPSLMEAAAFAGGAQAAPAAALLSLIPGATGVAPATLERRSPEPPPQLHHPLQQQGRTWQVQRTAGLGRAVSGGTSEDVLRTCQVGVLLDEFLEAHDVVVGAAKVTDASPGDHQAVTTSPLAELPQDVDEWERRAAAGAAGAAAAAAAAADPVTGSSRDRLQGLASPSRARAAASGEEGEPDDDHGTLLLLPPPPPPAPRPPAPAPPPLVRPLGSGGDATAISQLRGSDATRRLREITDGSHSLTAGEVVEGRDDTEVQPGQPRAPRFSTSPTSPRHALSSSSTSASPIIPPALSVSRRSVASLSRVSESPPGEEEDNTAGASRPTTLEDASPLLNPPPSPVSAAAPFAWSMPPPEAGEPRSVAIPIPGGASSVAGGGSGDGSIGAPAGAASLQRSPHASGSHVHISAHRLALASSNASATSGAVGLPPPSAMSAQHLGSTAAARRASFAHSGSTIGAAGRFMSPQASLVLRGRSGLPGFNGAGGSASTTYGGASPLMRATMKRVSIEGSNSSRRAGSREAQHAASVGTKHGVGGRGSALASPEPALVSGRSVQSGGASSSGGGGARPQQQQQQPAADAVHSATVNRNAYSNPVYVESPPQTRSKAQAKAQLPPSPFAAAHITGIASATMERRSLAGSSRGLLPAAGAAPGSPAASEHRSGPGTASSSKSLPRSPRLPSTTSSPGPRQGRSSRHQGDRSTAAKRKSAPGATPSAATESETAESATSDAGAGASAHGGGVHGSHVTHHRSQKLHLQPPLPPPLSLRHLHREQSPGSPARVAADSGRHSGASTPGGRSTPRWSQMGSVAGQRLSTAIDKARHGLMADGGLLAVEQSAALRHLDNTYSLLRQLRLVSLMVLFILFPTWAQAALSVFSCIRIDDGKGPFAEKQQAVSKYGYWVRDVTQECYKGVHLHVYVPVGAVSVALVCLLPPALTTFLLLRRRHQLKELHTQQVYGFMYRKYKPQFFWWEGLAQTQMLLLVAVQVFGQALPVYHQALLLLAGFLIISTLNMACSPARCGLLVVLSGVSMFVLSFTTVLGLFFADVGGGRGGAGSIAVDESVQVGVVSLILLSNVGLFVSYTIVTIRFMLEQARTREGALGTLVRRVSGGLTAAVSKARLLGDAAAGDLSSRLLSLKFSRRSGGDGGGGDGGSGPASRAQSARGPGLVPSTTSLRQHPPASPALSLKGRYDPTASAMPRQQPPAPPSPSGGAGSTGAHAAPTTPWASRLTMKRSSDCSAQQVQQPKAGGGGVAGEAAAAGGTPVQSGVTNPMPQPQPQQYLAAGGSSSRRERESTSSPLPSPDQSMAAASSPPPTQTPQLPTLRAAAVHVVLSGGAQSSTGVTSPTQSEAEFEGLRLGLSPSGLQHT
ncbi:hypothetical protein HYH02_010808 [Chlamydomonas schloesseri]|uniref:Uncharacterized protein n=1 Tax=Chlamydomonas schloesseri TaxID=2026947 RepID=A0A835T3M8_9CHLO|nr:hypothetical protein HYH02_010808 [Chlamydomonas schloesseri]|eukprot:KAG2438352.1 hypothetical protein HYH02_010808 [Chlamydomonas schloesseri]